MPTIKNLFSDIADAIREKRGIVKNIKAINFAEEIRQIDAIPKQTGDGEHCLTLIDNNGNILEEIYLNEGEFYELDDLPKNNMVFEYWISSEQINNNLIKMPNHDVVAGPIYSPESGKTEIDFELNKASGLTVYLNMSGVKDWGDGTSDDSQTHTYENYGEYTITCDGTLTGSGGSFSYILGHAANSNTNKVRDLVYEVRFGNNITSIPSGTLDNFKNIKNIYFNKNTTSISGCSSTGIKSIILPKNISYIGAQCFSGTKKSKYVVLPYSENMSNYNHHSFSQNISLKKVIFPECITDIGNYCFNGCTNLEYISFPTNLEKIGQYVFNKTNISNLELFEKSITLGPNSFDDCPNFETLTLKNIKEISNFSFYYANIKNLYILTDIDKIYNQSFSYYNLNKIDFTKCTKVLNIDFDLNLSSYCKVYVPDNLYEEWIMASKWKDCANNIYKESEMEV